MDKRVEIADQIIQEERTRKAISIILAKKDLATRTYIDRIYSDPDLKSLYNGLRAEAKLSSNHDDRKLSIKFPDPTVWKFCDDVMKAKYGEEWLQEPKIFYEDIIRPWIIRPR